MAGVTLLDLAARCVQEEGLGGRGGTPWPEDALHLDISSAKERDENKTEAGLERRFSCKTLSASNGTSAEP